MPLDDMSLPVPASWLRPAFSSSRVSALMTTRDGGVSEGAYASFNPRPGLGDDPAHVMENRRRLRAWTDARPSVLLRQVHGIDVVSLEGMAPSGDDADELAWGPQADACWTRGDTGVCEIQVADCLPVLFADRDGRVVGAAHAGWRGLVGGVLEATVAAMTSHPGVTAGVLEAWLGPCIGPDAFEVGDEVREAFVSATAADACHFRAGRARGKWWADLPALARARLSRAGVGRMFGNDGSVPWCTHAQARVYHSYRRDRECGRMSAVIWLRS